MPQRTEKMNTVRTIILAAQNEAVKNQYDSARSGHPDLAERWAEVLDLIDEAMDEVAAFEAVLAAVPEPPPGVHCASCDGHSCGDVDENLAHRAAARAQTLAGCTPWNGTNVRKGRVD